MTSHALYGILPPLLGLEAPQAVQLSPFIPGSQAIEALADASLTHLIIHAPPGTIERQAVLAHGLRALTPGGSLVALAPKDKGGSRLAKELEQFGCVVQEDARRHFRICSTTRPAQLTPLSQAIEAGALQYVPATQLWSQPGVFSWNEEDKGTALLLAHVPALAGRGADLGSGIGSLSRAALAHSPAITELTLVDSDRRAIDAAKRNIADTRAMFCWADVRQPLPCATLDFVLMNPPFHDGGMEDKTLGQWFVTCAASLLKTGGVCWLIANRHLPYEALLHQAFRTVTLHTETNLYKLYKAEK